MHPGLVVAWLGLLLSACHSGSSSPSNDADGGDDSNGPCQCLVGGVAIACGTTGCAGGIQYDCTPEAEPIAGVLCGPMDAATENTSCVPTCNGKTCGNSDECGGTCQCATGVPCNVDGTCGNGCELIAGDPCELDAGTADTCCGSGYLCLVHDSGASACCVAYGGAGQCSADTDCCDYPVLHCDPTTHSCTQ